MWKGKTGMKNSIAKIRLLIGYCIPFVFLAMNEDVTIGTLWFYIVMTIGFGVLCYGSVKIKSLWIVVVGNILSFTSSCIFTYFLRTEKWGWYFKPFTPYQLIAFETIIAFLIQIIFVIYYKRKSNGKNKK